MLTRLIGCDAEIEFPAEMLDAIRSAEEKFPAPEYTVLLSDSDEDDQPDELVIGRRFSGVLMPVAFVDFDEIVQMEADGYDWLADLASDLARTEAEIEAAVETSDVGEVGEVSEN